jgi:hypothetical protein
MSDDYQHFHFEDQACEPVEDGEKFDDVPLKTLIVSTANLRIPLVQFRHKDTYFDLILDLRHGLRSEFVATHSAMPQPVEMVAYEPERKLAFMGTFESMSIVDQGLEGTYVKVNIQSKMVKVGDWSHILHGADAGGDAATKAAGGSESQRKSMSDKIVSGAKKVLETAGQWAVEYHENVKKAEHDEWKLGLKQGVWYSEKPVPLLFDQIQKQLMKPIGKHRMSISAQPVYGTIAANTSWQEYHSAAYPQAYRELQINLELAVEEDGATRVRYEWLVNENPPGGIDTGLIIKSVNQWLQILCNDASSAP